jgi:hypothetical protein
VAAVRVHGEPDPEWGRRVVAEVVLTGVFLEEVVARARTLLRPAELPRRWEVVPALRGKLD